MCIRDRVLPPGERNPRRRGPGRHASSAPHSGGAPRAQHEPHQAPSQLPGEQRGQGEGALQPVQHEGHQQHQRRSGGSANELAASPPRYGTTTCPAGGGGTTPRASRPATRLARQRTGASRAGATAAVQQPWRRNEKAWRIDITIHQLKKSLASLQQRVTASLAVRHK